MCVMLRAVGPESDIELYEKRRVFESTRLYVLIRSEDSAWYLWRVQ